MTCWFCQRTDGEVVRYAFVETPTREAFPAHAECVERNGIGGELVPLVIEPSVGDV